MRSSSRTNDLLRIRHSLNSVAEMILCRNVRDVSVSYANNGDPVTSLDRDINRIILNMLPGEGEGWLSEESSDNLDRLRFSRVWVVDPIDGTREFVEGIPEWCVSIALVEEHEAVAGGILNPSTGEMFLGSVETGLEIVDIDIAGTCRPDRPSERGATPCVLVSRREHRQGKWESYKCSEMNVAPIGSIAYRLAQVAAGYAEATCTFEPRSEWDVAAGVALVHAAGGRVRLADGSPVRFNQEAPLLQNFFACGKDCPSWVPKRCGVKV